VIAIIQCAARKRPDAGYLRTRDGTRVLFVAEPEAAPLADSVIYARPDDTVDGTTWRKQLLAYNRNPVGNPLGLLPAFELYQNEAYRKLAAKVGSEKLFILSAGWGLIGASFLTPYYDITFTAQADAYKRRRKNDRYHDLAMLPPDTEEPIVFFGGKDYLPLFDHLSSGVHAPRIVFFNSASAPRIGHARTIRFQTSTPTNWHYECVDAFLSGALDCEIGSPERGVSVHGSKLFRRAREQA
jgi:hypothetical protein